MTDRPALEDPAAEPERVRWCCDGNAEDCPLCDTAALPYPWICPGHPDTEGNRQRAQAAAEPDRASEAAEVQRLRRMVRQIMTGNRAAVDKLTDAHKATIGELRRAEARVRALEERLRLVTDEKVADVVGPNIELLCEANARLKAEIAAARKFADQMREFCSPHGVAVDYADRLTEAMDRAKGELAPGVREVRVVVHAPTDENAAHWAETIRDLVAAEYGDSMRLDITITPGGPA